METEKAEVLLERPWVRQRLAETHRELRKQSSEVYRIPLTDENMCVFLGADRRCMIEVNEGLHLKPHECQRFPFATVRMPDGTAVHDSSAACKSIAEKLILAFEPIQPKPKATETLEEGGDSVALSSPLQAWLEDIGTFPEKVRPAPFRKGLPWSSYLDYQKQWQSAFVDNEMSLQDCFTQVRQQLGIQAIFPANGLTGAFFTLFFLRKPYRTLSWMSLLLNGRYHDPRLFGEALDLKRVGQVGWASECDQHLKAFAWNVLSRKRLLSAGGSLQSLVAMAEISVMLVRWYAKALASLQESSRVSEKDVVTAIRLVERYYSGHQPRFFNWFLSPWNGWLVSHFTLT